MARCLNDVQRNGSKRSNFPTKTRDATRTLYKKDFLSGMNRGSSIPREMEFASMVGYDATATVAFVIAEGGCREVNDAANNHRSPFSPGLSRRRR